MKLKTIVGCLAMVIALSITGLGQASKLQDLRDVRASSGESELESRGYHVVHTSKTWFDSYTYWWNPSSKKCVSVKTNGGRYVAIVDTPNADCYQKEDTGMSAGAKAGIAAGAAAAIIGAIALSHKSHNHADNKHYEDVNQEAEYERGYRDGLYNSAYHNYSNTEQYRVGYSAGVEQRRIETSHSSGWGGYRPHVFLNDLIGVRGASGESELQNRGFRNVDGFKSSKTSYTIWWNARTGQCIQVATADGRYDSIVDIGNHPNCR